MTEFNLSQWIMKDRVFDELGNQYCKVWECRKMGLKRYNGYCEEHKYMEVKLGILPNFI